MVTSKGQPLASLFQSNFLQFNSAGQQETPQQQSQIEVFVFPLKFIHQGRHPWVEKEVDRQSTEALNLVFRKKEKNCLDR